MPSNVRLLCGGIAILVGMSRLAAAQGGATPAAATSGFVLGSTDPTADTGRMVPAHASWASYTTAGRCVAAIQTVQYRARRQEGGDSKGKEGYGPLFVEGSDLQASSNGLYNPVLTEGGRLPAPVNVLPIAMAAGRACAQRLTLATAPAVTLPDFLMLALAIHDDTLAQAVVRRQRALAATPHAQIMTLARAFEVAVAMSPPRIDLANVFLRQLDSLPDAWIERFYARKTLMALSTIPAAKAAYQDTLVELSAHLTPVAFEQGEVGVDVFDLYRGYLGQLRSQAATDTRAAETYRNVRARYLALGAQLRTAGVLDQAQLKHLNAAPPPL